jgi:hypothetical protein
LIIPPSGEVAGLSLPTLANLQNARRGFARSELIKNEGAGLGPLRRLTGATPWKPLRQPARDQTLSCSRTRHGPHPNGRPARAPDHPPECGQAVGFGQEGVTVVSLIRRTIHEGCGMLPCDRPLGHRFFYHSGPFVERLLMAHRHSAGRSSGWSWPLADHVFLLRMEKQTFGAQASP